MKFKISKLDEIYKQYEAEREEQEGEELKKKYLGKDGVMTTVLRSIGELPAEERADFGQEANVLKTYIEETIEISETGIYEATTDEMRIDPTAPFDLNTPEDKRPQLLQKVGSKHPLTTELEYILSIFQNMGFDIFEARQLDDDYHTFESLNFPPGHPARDLWDTFWTDEGLIPTPHTSAMQNRILSSQEPPIRAVIPGRCFRNEATDASHEHTLHQIEGVYVDENISVGDMTGTIKTYLEEFFGVELKVKVQPAYFPFTEPDMEFLISCPFCGGSGCSTCGKSGWIEAMGCGMIHPNVLEEAGIDSEKYNGFAWGFGLDRLVMIKNSIQDIRWLHSGKLEFINQF